MRFQWVLPLFLFGCDADPAASATPVPASCDDDCLVEGVQTFQVGPDSRELHVFLPEQPVGAPVLFVWHHLGGSPEELLEWMPLDDATDAGFIVVAPASRGLFGTKWELAQAPAANPDVKLFDAVLEALIEQVDAEPHAYVAGFSAGGLFSTFLTLHRSERLAGAAPFSGGSPAASYVSPSDDIPVMLSWGGASDTMVGFDFDDATRYAADALVADGHLVLTCDHGLGHWLPADAASRTIAWFSGIEDGQAPDFTGCVRHQP